MSKLHDFFLKVSCCLEFCSQLWCSPLTNTAEPLIKGTGPRFPEAEWEVLGSNLGHVTSGKLVSLVGIRACACVLSRSVVLDSL